MKRFLRGRLWSDADFLKLWSGQAISQLGNRITVLALPTVAVLQLHAGPFEVGLLVALERLPFPFLALPAGVWVDRVRRRPLMIACDVGRCLALASIPIAALAGVLTLTQLYVVALVMGCFWVFFDVSYLTYLPALVSRQDILEGNMKLTATDSAAQFLGPGLAGLLIQAVGAAYAIVANAFTYVVSVLALLLIGRPEAAPDRERGKSALGELLEGLRFVFGNRLLASQNVFLGIGVMGGLMIQGPFYVFAYRHLHLTPALLGLILTFGGTGSLLGSALTGVVGRRLGIGPTIALGFGVTALCDGALPLALWLPAAAFLVANFFIASLTGTISDIQQVSLRQGITPPRYQGRMNAAFRTVVWGAMPIGSLLGGWLATEFGFVPLFLVAAGVGLLGSTGVFLSPLGRLHGLPEPVA